MKYAKALGIFLILYLLIGNFVIPILTALLNVNLNLNIPHEVGPVIFFFLGIYFAIKSLKKIKKTDLKHSLL